MSMQVEENIAVVSSPVGPPSVAPEVSPTQDAREVKDIPQRPGTECYDTLLWRLQDLRDPASEAAFLVGLAGCSRKSGVSTLATNLAVRAADHQMGPVLLADMDFRQPSLARLLGARDDLGLADVLAGQVTLDECVRSTQFSNLNFLPMGDVSKLSRISVDPGHIEAVFAQLREEYSVVVCDLPESGALENANPLAAALDAVLLVVRSESERRRKAQTMVRRLAEDGVPLIGAVVTDQQEYLPTWLSRLL